MAEIELVIFDCDGVLVDSEWIAVQIDQVVLRRFGLHMSESEVIARFVGRAPKVMRGVIEEHLGHPLPEAWEKEAEELYVEAYERGLTTVDGIEQALDQIPYPTCVASSSEPDSLRHKLELTGLFERFEGRIFSAAEVKNGKPAPDLFLHAAARMGAQPAACVVVEDSRHGVEAARAANMDVFAYGAGVTAPEALAGERTVVFNEMRDLPELLRARDPGRAAGLT
jgi:HAD superfamily hydrolase (TIGR01509 family)